MSYASNADVLSRMGSRLYVQLTDDAGTGSADEAKVTDARLGAEAEADSYLGRRYQVPIDGTIDAEVAACLKSIAINLVEYRLHARRPPVPDDVRLKYEATIQWLRRIASGEALLPSAVEIPANEAIGIVGELTHSERIMSREELENL